jgi:hypothetical protein
LASCGDYPFREQAINFRPALSPDRKHNTMQRLSLGQDLYACRIPYMTDAEAGPFYDVVFTPHPGFVARPVRV